MAICIGCKKGELFYMDSLFQGRIPQKIAQQIANLLKSEEDVITVNILPVQQQSNSVDCGVYSIAFVRAILGGNTNLDGVNFDHVKMRTHLLSAPLKNRLDMFPTTTKTVKKCDRKIIEINVFCTCRQIWSKSDSRIPAK
eukprot:gene13552-14952_t